MNVDADDHGRSDPSAIDRSDAPALASPDPDESGADASPIRWIETPGGDLILIPVTDPASPPDLDLVWSLPPLPDTVRILPDDRLFRDQPALHEAIFTVESWELVPLVDLRRVPLERLSIRLAERLSAALNVMVELPSAAVTGELGSRTYGVGADGEPTSDSPVAYRAVARRSELPQSGSASGSASVSPPDSPMARSGSWEEPARTSFTGGWIVRQLGRSVFLHTATTPPQLFERAATRAAGAPTQRIIVLDGSQTAPGDVWSAIRQAWATPQPDVAWDMFVVETGPPATAGQDASSIPSWLDSYHDIVTTVMASLPEAATAEDLMAATVELSESLANLRTEYPGRPRTVFAPAGSDPTGNWPPHDDGSRPPTMLDTTGWRMTYSRRLFDPAHPDNQNVTTRTMAAELALHVLSAQVRVEQLVDVLRFLAQGHRTVDELSRNTAIAHPETLQAAVDHPYERGTAPYERGERLHSGLSRAASEARRVRQQRFRAAEARRSRLQARAQHERASGHPDAHRLRRLEVGWARATIARNIWRRAEHADVWEAEPVALTNRLQKLLRERAGVPGTRRRDAGPARTVEPIPAEGELADGAGQRRSPATADARAWVRPAAAADRPPRRDGWRLANPARVDAWRIRRPARVEVVTEPAAVASAVARLALSDTEVVEMVRTLRLGVWPWDRFRAIEAVSVHRELAVDLRAALDLLTLVRQQQPATTATRPLTRAQVLEAVRATQPSPGAPDRSDLERLAVAARAAAASGDLSWATVDALLPAFTGPMPVDVGVTTRAWLEAAGLQRRVLDAPGLTGDPGLRRLRELVAFLRASFPAQVPVQRMPDLSDLAPLARAVLGHDGRSPVTSAHVWQLSQALSDAAARGEPSLGGLRVAVLANRQRELSLDALVVAGRELGLDPRPRTGRFTGWRQTVEAIALRAALGTAQDAPSLRQLHQLLGVLRSDFPEQAGAVDGPLELADLLPVVRATLDPTADAVTVPQVLRLARAVELAAPRRLLSPAGLRVADRQAQLNISAEQVAESGQALGIDAGEPVGLLGGLSLLTGGRARIQHRLDQWRRAVEAMELHRVAERLSLSAPAELGELDRILELARRSLRIEQSPAIGSLHLEHLLPLVRAVLDPRAAAVRPADIGSLVEAMRALDRVRASSSVADGNRGTAWSVGELRAMVQAMPVQRALGLSHEQVSELLAQTDQPANGHGWARALEAERIHQAVIAQPGSTWSGGLPPIADIVTVLRNSHSRRVARLNRLVELDDLLLLVRQVLAPRAETVEPAHLAALAPAAHIAVSRGEPTVVALLAARRLVPLHAELQIPLAGLNKIADALAAPPGVAGLLQAIEAVRLHRWAVHGQPDLAGQVGQRAMHTLLTLLRTEFPSPHAAPGAWQRPDHLAPLLQAVTGQPEVDEDRVVALARAADLARRTGGARLPDVQRSYAATALANQLRLTQPRVAEYRETLGLESDVDGRAKAVEAAAFAGSHGVAVAHAVLTRLRIEFPDQVAAVTGVLELDHLQPLVQAVTGTTPDSVTQQDADRVAAALVEARRRGDVSLRSLATADVQAQTAGLNAATADHAANALGLPATVEGWWQAVEAWNVHGLVSRALPLAYPARLRSAHRVARALRSLPGSAATVPRPLGPVDLLPLWRELIPTDAVDVTALMQIVDAAHRRGDPNLAGLRTAAAQYRSGLTDDQLGVDANAGPYRWRATVEAAALAAELWPGPSTSESRWAARDLVVLLRANFGDVLPNDRPLGLADLDLLRDAVLVNRSGPVTSDDADALVGAARSARGRIDPASPPGTGMAAPHLLVAMQLGLSADGVRQLRERLGLTGVAGLTRAVEAAWLQRTALERDGATSDGLRAAYALLSLTRRLFDNPARPLGLADLGPLAQAILGVDEVTEETVPDLARAVGAAQAFGSPTPDALRVGHLQVQAGLSTMDMQRVGDVLGVDPAAGVASRLRIVRAVAMVEVLESLPGAQPAGPTGDDGLQVADELVELLRTHVGDPPEENFARTDLLTLWTATVDPGAADVGVDEIARLHGALPIAGEFGDGSPSSLATAVAHRDLRLTASEPSWVIEALGLPSGTAGWQQATEILRLYRVAFPSGMAADTDLRSVQHLLTLLRSDFHDQVAGVVGPLSLEHVQPVWAAVGQHPNTIEPAGLTSLLQLVGAAARHGDVSVRGLQAASVQRQLGLSGDGLTDADGPVGGSAARWRSEVAARGLARAIADAALLDDETRLPVARLLVAAMADQFPADRPLTLDDLGSLATRLPATLPTTDANRRDRGVSAIELVDLVAWARRYGATRVTLPMLGRSAAARVGQQVLRLSDARLAAVRRTIGAPDSAEGFAQAVEAEILYRRLRTELSEVPDDDARVAVHHILTMIREGFRQHLEQIGAVLNLDDLLPLVVATADPDAAHVRPDHVVALIYAAHALPRPSRASEEAPKVLVRAPITRVSALAAEFRQAASRPEGIDGSRSRAAERDAVRAFLPTGVAAQTASPKNLRALVATRRSWLPDRRTRGFTDLSAYAPMAQELLDTSRVDGAVLESLADLVRRARHGPTAGPAAGRRARTVAWARRGLARAKRVVRIYGVSRAALADAAINRDWTTRIPDRPPQGFDDTELLTLDQVPVRFSHEPELLAWINAITPGGRAGLSEDDLKWPLRTKFTETKTQGITFVRTVGGRELQIDLHRGLPSPPVVRTAPGRSRQETARGHAHGPDNASSQSMGWLLDAGGAFVTKFGHGPVGLLVPPTVGYVWGADSQSSMTWKGEQSVSATSDGPATDLVVPATWWVQLTDRRTGRVQVREWTDDDGVPRQTAIAVLRSAPAQSAYPSPWQTIQANRDLALSGLHKVEMLAVADQLRQRVQELIGPQFYSHFQGQIEEFIADRPLGDQLSAARAGHDAVYDPTTPSAYDSWQRTPRLRARGGGRFLTLALTANAIEFRDPGRSSAPRPDSEISVSIAALSGSSARRGGARGVRAALPPLARFWGAVAGVDGRIVGRRVWFRQAMRENRARVSRSVATRGHARPADLRLEFIGHANWGWDSSTAELEVGPGAVLGEPGQASGRTLPVPGVARMRQWETVPAALPAPDPERRWWAVGGRHALTLATVTDITDLAEAYNVIVPALVDRGLLPVEALGEPGTRLTPAQVLTELPIADGVLNQPGATFANWRILVEEVLEPTVLLQHLDDITGTDASDAGPIQPGLAKRLTHPDGSTTTLGVAGRLEPDQASRSGTEALRTSDGLDWSVGVGASRGVKYRVDWVIAGQGLEKADPVGGSLLPREVVPVGTMPTRLVRREGGKATAEWAPDGVGSEVTPIGDSDRFAIPLRLRLTLRDGTDAVTLYEATAAAKAYQPTALTALARREPPAPLVVTTASGAEIASPLVGLVLLAPASAAGLDPLRQALLDRRLATAAARKRDGDAEPTGDTDPRSGRTFGLGSAIRLARAGLGAASDPVARKFPSLRDRLLDERRELRMKTEQEVWHGLSMSRYRASLPRSLSGGAEVLFGTESGVLTVRPVGRPQILAALPVASRLTRISRDEHASEADRTRVGVWLDLFGYRTGAADAAGVGGGWITGGYDRSIATLGNDLIQVLSEAGDAYLVRTAVVNDVRMADGTVVRKAGEALLLFRARQIEAIDRSQLDDPYRQLPASPLPASADRGPTRRPPASLRDGRLRVGTWEIPIGTGPAYEKITEDARRFGGEKLVSLVQPLLSGLDIAQLDDDGRAFPLAKGVVLRIRARTIGAAVHRGDNDGRDMAGSGGRHGNTSSAQGTLTGTYVNLFSGNKAWLDNLTTAELGGSVDQTTLYRQEEGLDDTWATASGVRLSRTAEFEQKIELSYAFTGLRVASEETDPARAVGKRAGRAVEVRRLHVPLDLAPAVGARSVSWSGQPRSHLPADTLVGFVHGLAGIHAAVRSGRGVRHGPVARSDDDPLLDRQSLEADLPKLAVPGGQRYSGVKTAAGTTILPNGVVLSVVFGAPREIRYLPRVPNTSSQETSHHASAGDSSGLFSEFTGYAGARSVLKPGIEGGGRLVVGGERITFSDRAHPGGSNRDTSAVEDRQSRLAVYLPARFFVDKESGRPQEVPGSAWLLLTEAGAAEFGLPASVFDAAKREYAAAHPSTTGDAEGEWLADERTMRGPTVFSDGLISSALGGPSLSTGWGVIGRPADPIGDLDETGLFAHHDDEDAEWPQLQLGKPAAGPTVAEAAGVVVEWLIAENWRSSLAFFRDHQTVLAGAEARTALGEVPTVTPDRRSTHTALLDLARLHWIEDGYAYLTRADPAAVLLNVANNASHREVFAAFGQLADRVATSTTRVDQLSAVMIHAIEAVLGNDPDRAVQFAVQARRLLVPDPQADLDDWQAGLQRAQADWMLALVALGRRRPAAQTKLNQVSRILHSCAS
jgi:hypothetical protein